MSKQAIIISLLKEIDKNIDNINDSGGINANLEELTITENGTYTPSEGVDGFSQVVAQVVPTNRVVLPNNTKITKACIDENGYWAAELVDVSLATSLVQFFLDCTKLVYADVSGWDVGNATNMFMMFRNCNSLVSIDVSNWDTGNVTNMQQMFSPCNQLQHLDVSNWNVSNVRNFSGMFNCPLLEVIDVSNWDFSSATNISSMFNGCKAVKRLDVGHIDTQNITNLGSMFYNCRSIETLDISNWDVSNVVDLNNTFGICENLSVDLSNWNTSSVTNMQQTFSDCTNMTNINIKNWDASSVTNTTRMFNRDSNLTTLIGGETIENVIANNISTLINLKIGLSLYTTNLDRASLRAVINGLADLTGQTAQTLTIGGTLLAKLTAEDIAVATNKNWTIA